MEVHFDGKIRKQWGLRNDFLAVCVTGKGMAKEKFLGDVPIPEGTGKKMAETVWKLLQDWGIASRMFAICFDTTSSNTGCERGNIIKFKNLNWPFVAASKSKFVSSLGANVFLEFLKGHVLWWIECIHHVADLLLEAAIVSKLGPTPGPKEKYFSKFKSYFNTLSDEEKEKIVTEAAAHIGLLTPEDDVTKEFHARSKAFFTEFMASDNSFQRGDYLEFARIVMVRCSC